MILTITTQIPFRPLYGMTLSIQTSSVSKAVPCIILFYTCEHSQTTQQKSNAHSTQHEARNAGTINKLGQSYEA